jgi:hypothetical protein
MCKRNVFVFLASCDGQGGGMDPWRLRIGCWMRGYRGKENGLQK